MPLKKNILIVSQELPPMIGGAGIVALQNATLLADIGHTVTLLSVKGGNSLPESKNFKIITVPRIPKVWVLFLAWHIKHLPLNTYDAIIVNDIGAALVFSLFFINNSNVIGKTFIYLHGGEIRSIFEKPNKFFKLVHFTEKYINLLKRCKGIIAVSNYMKNYFISRCPTTISQDKIHVVYAGIDDKLFYPISTNIRTEIGIPAERTLLLSVSRITKDKGYDIMLEIFAKIIAQDKRFHWIIVGNGPYLEQLKKKAKEMNLLEYITFTGSVQRTQLPYYYSCSDLFWLLSEREAFGLVYIEAQACGVPAMGFRRCGVVEAINEGISGYLVDDAEESVPILMARDYLFLDKKKIISFAEQFYLTKQIHKLASLL